MKFHVGQAVRIVGPAKDKDDSRLGQIGVILHTIGDGLEFVVVMFGKMTQTFCLNSIKAV